MSNLREREREKYETMWHVAGYAAMSPGEKFLPIFLDMTRTTMRGSVIDAGCGSGKGAVALAKEGFRIQRICDLTDAGLIPEAEDFPFSSACLWEDNLDVLTGFADWVYCCDVLEHIPTQFTMLVVSRLLSLARRGLFLSISTVPDAFGVWVGEPLHQTVQPFVWWRDNLKQLGKLVEARDLINAGCFLLEPKK